MQNPNEIKLLNTNCYIHISYKQRHLWLIIINYQKNCVNGDLISDKIYNAAKKVIYDDCFLKCAATPNINLAC